MSAKPLRVLVAGGTGFLGSAIAGRLREDGALVHVASRSGGVDLGDRAAVSQLPPHDVIVHAAGSPLPRAIRDAPRAGYRDHLLVTLNLVGHARRSRARLVLASTFVYGNAPRVPAAENDEVRPHSPYAASRALAESLCHACHRDFGVPVDVLRVFNAYGPGQAGEFVVPTIVEGARSGRIALADPAPRRDFVHVDDVARAFALAVRRREPAFEIFNVGSGESRSIDSVARAAARLAGRDVEIVYSGAVRADEIPDARADTGKAARMLGWRAEVGFEAGLASLIGAAGSGTT